MYCKETILVDLASFALGDDDKVDLQRQSRFSFTLDDVIVKWVLHPMHDHIITL